MNITLKLHLEELATQERGRPEDIRRAVPTLTELADAVNVHRASISNLANNRTRQLDLDLAARIIAHLRRLGFKTKVSDLLRYEEKPIDDYLGDDNERS